MGDEEQLNLGQDARPSSASSFVTDDQLVDTLGQVDKGLVQVQNGLEHLQSLVPSMVRAVGAARELVGSVRRHLGGSA